MSIFHVAKKRSHRTDSQHLRVRRQKMEIHDPQSLFVSQLSSGCSRDRIVTSALNIDLEKTFSWIFFVPFAFALSLLHGVFRDVHPLPLEYVVWIFDRIEPCSRVFPLQGWCNVTGIFGAGMMQFELTYYKYFSSLPTPPKELSVYS